MIQARRLGYAILSTPDIASQLPYWIETLGLHVVDERDGCVVLATRQGVETIVLTQGATAGLAGVSFQIAGTTLDAACDLLRAQGLDARRCSGATRGTRDAVAFHDPGGTEVFLFDELHFAGRGTRQQGVATLKLGHVAHLVPHVETLAGFYERTLGFRRSDWRADTAMFMRCGPDHHTMNFFKGGPRLQHVAFEVESAAELARAADLLTWSGFTLDWGPGRHHIGHNMACYHSNADGIRVELYCEMDQMLDEALGFYDPRPWHDDRPQRPKDWGPVPRNAWIPEAP